MNDTRLDELRLEMLARLDAIGASTVFPSDEVANLRVLRELIEDELPGAARELEGQARAHACRI